jgi:hypothetical protein
MLSQFVTMSKMLECGMPDFVCEVSANRKVVYLNFLFWAQFDFAPPGIGQTQRDSVIRKLREAWDFNHIEMPPPVGR